MSSSLCEIIDLEELRELIRFFDLLTRAGIENDKRCCAEQEIDRAKEQLEVRVEERT